VFSYNPKGLIYLLRRKNNEEILVSFVDHEACHGIQLSTFIPVQTMKFVTTAWSSTNLLSLSENKSVFV
jgi:hypothetical protein